LQSGISAREQIPQLLVPFVHDLPTGEPLPVDAMAMVPDGLQFIRACRQVTQFCQGGILALAIQNPANLNLPDADEAGRSQTLTLTDSDTDVPHHFHFHHDVPVNASHPDVVYVLAYWEIHPNGKIKSFSWILTYP
jgi:hypothetical protein